LVPIGAFALNTQDLGSLSCVIAVTQIEEEYSTVVMGSLFYQMVVALYQPAEIATYMLWSSWDMPNSFIGQANIQVLSNPFYP